MSVLRALLAHHEFLKVFAAQVLALVAIGVMTVSLSLTAFEFGGVAFGGLFFGGILALKMVAYVLVAPVAEAVLSRYPRRRVLITINGARLVLVGLMALSAASWSILVLSFLVFAVSAGFTPLLQSTIPELLPDEALYSKGLALSRIAYTMEAFLSPAVAGMALGLVAPSSLFVLPALLFAASAAVLLVTRLPAQALAQKAPFGERLSRGLKIYVRTPRLRGLWLVQFALTLPLASVLVNSVIYAGLHSDAPHVLYPQLMMWYGLGTAGGALLVPVLVPRFAERTVMIIGATLFAMVGMSVILSPPGALAFAVWAGLGVAASLVLTPGGLVIARSAEPANRPAVFAAQFALSHAGWLFAYPLAGSLGAVLGPGATMAALSIACLAVTLVAWRAWPAGEADAFAHDHPELPHGHPHFEGVPRAAHSHRYFIDELHPHWPQRSG